MDEQQSITRLLRRWDAGEAAAGDELFPLVYGQLRELASARLWQERQDHTLQPTALVHEAFLKLQAHRDVDWQCRGQFLGYTARVMRQVLVDHARARGRSKRGQGWQKVPLTEIAETVHTPEGILALDEALQWLATMDSGMHRIVELRFFGGLTHQEIAELLELSQTTVRRRWRTAKAWLHRRLRQGVCDG